MLEKTDWYPVVSLRFEPSGATLVGDLDTGAPLTFISYEWLLENNVVEPKSMFGRAMLRFADSPSIYSFVQLQLKASLAAGTTRSTPAVLTVQAVRDWNQSPFCRADRDRIALIGRDVLKQFGATIEIDGTTGETKLIAQNWESFEAEVADLFRALGLKVRHNYNLAGNQIDVFLSEKTTSGKEIHTVVECKFHQKPVGTQYVRQLASLYEFAKAQGMAEHAILVSSSGFSKDAHLVAEAAGIELLEIGDLRGKASSPHGLPHPLPSELPPEKPPEELTERTAFVIMPFSEEYRDLYMLGIRDTLANHGFVCRRADGIEFNGRIMDQVLDLIRASDLIVAEVSQHNPNVYYELGISHALEKNVVLCTKDAGNLPFDTRDLNHIVYSDIVDLREKLSIRLKSLIIPIDD